MSLPVYFILVTIFSFGATFNSKDKNRTFLKVTLILVAQILFPLHLCEVKSLSKYSSCLLWKKEKKKKRESNISVVGAFLREITEKNSLILSQTTTLETKSLFREGRKHSSIKCSNVLGLCLL